MSDMLVKLYDLPPLTPALDAMASINVTIRRALPHEKYPLTDWVDTNFGKPWRGETDVSLAKTPPACFVAILDETLVGFACHDAVCRGFFGPIGVDESYRGKGIGKALLLACLHGMHQLGHAYAIIGMVGPTEFYASQVGAIIIPNSTPGIWATGFKQS